MNDRLGRVLRIVAIVLLGLTAAMNIMGGVGTTCAAFGLSEEYRTAFIELQEYSWLYQTLVFTTTLTGLAGVWAAVALARGKGNAFRNAMIVLVIGTLLGVIHYIASMTLRGQAAPANMKFFANVLTLVVFLVIRIPGIWRHMDFAAPEDRVGGAAAGGFAAIVAGAIVLSVASWAGPSHAYHGENWVLVLGRPLELSGMTLVAVGALLLALALYRATRSMWLRLPDSALPEDA